jgi:prepilin-type N-terminal cleavage/methylation domain-containing protein
MIKFNPRQAAFTLVELMVVMAIIGIMSALGVAAFRGGGATSGAQGASVLASGLFTAARSEAILRKTSTRVYVDTDNTHGSTYLKRATVAYQSISGSVTNWVQCETWTVWPGNVIYVPGYSVPHGSDNSLYTPGLKVVGSGLDYFQFNSIGQAENPNGTTRRAKFVVAPGQGSSGAPVVQNSLQSYGFILLPLGQVGFIQDLSTLTNSGLP